MLTNRSLVPGTYASPYPALTPLAKSRRPEPSGRNVTMVAAQLELGEQWSQVVETLSTNRPPGDTTMPLLDAPSAGPRTIVLRTANRVPCNPPKASTRPIDAT